MKRQKGLGRGLEALLGAPPRANDATSAGQAPPRVPLDAPLEVPLGDLATGSYQPRGAIPEVALAELAASIREQGILQPLVVRPAAPSADGARYEIVAGERRWRAARLAGLASVPVIVRRLDDRAALAVALIENLQREDLNPLDQARSLARLATEFELTHDDVARAVGRSRASVTNLLRLLSLDAEVQAMLADGRLQMGHARALLPLEARVQVALARRCHARGLSVRQVEELVRRRVEATARDAVPRPPANLQTKWLQSQVRAELGHEFAILPRRDGGYGLKIGFGDLSELEGSLTRMLDFVRRVRDAAGPRARESAG